MDALDALGLIDLALSLCKTIYNMVSTVKANKQLCRQLADKVKSLEDLVLSVSGQSGQVSSPVYKALKKLCENLESARYLTEEFSTMKAFSCFMMSSSMKEKFQDMDKRLSDNLHMLSGALLVEQRKVLHQVYATVGGGRWCPTPPAAATRPTSLETFVSPSSIPTATTPVSCIMSPMPVHGFMTCMVSPAALTPMNCSPTSVSISTKVSPRVLKSLQASQALISLNQLFNTKSV